MRYIVLTVVLILVSLILAPAIMWAGRKFKEYLAKSATADTTERIEKDGSDEHY